MTKTPITRRKLPSTPGAPASRAQRISLHGYTDAWINPPGRVHESAFDHAKWRRSEHQGVGVLER